MGLYALIEVEGPSRTETRPLRPLLPMEMAAAVRRAVSTAFERRGAFAVPVGDLELVALTNGLGPEEHLEALAEIDYAVNGRVRIAATCKDAPLKAVLVAHQKLRSSEGRLMVEECEPAPYVVAHASFWSDELLDYSPLERALVLNEIADEVIGAVIKSNGIPWRLSDGVLLAVLPERFEQVVEALARYALVGVGRSTKSLEALELSARALSRLARGLAKENPLIISS
ncbi:MAG: GTP cyclohydrolase IIa [Desulfurococcaceae archaeon]